MKKEEKKIYRNVYLSNFKHVMTPASGCGGYALFFYIMHPIYSLMIIIELRAAQAKFWRSARARQLLRGASYHASTIRIDIVGNFNDGHIGFRRLALLRVFFCILVFLFNYGYSQSIKTVMHEKRCRDIEQCEGL